ncbi:MAG: hypothetical protein OXN23_03650 [Gammaproteobacteria bacterium]|nr:hypothetical protein [Gammaproteobacteria bacterium]
MKKSTMLGLAILFFAMVAVGTSHLWKPLPKNPATGMPQTAAEERWERIVEGAKRERERMAELQAQVKKKSPAELSKLRAKAKAEQHPCLPLNPESRRVFEDKWWDGFSSRYAKDDPECLTRIQIAFRMRNLIKSAGYRCDTITTIIPFVIDRGFNVYCMGHRYSYEVEDKGGRWHVEVD